MFQFQTGSIKSIIKKLYAGDVSTFQFQTGSIKSIQYGFTTFQFICFNSKLVRLKVTTRIGTRVMRRDLFQFQTGAIRSIL